MKKVKGITLISLVVTIIILIILAGVSINLILGENGIIKVAKQAVGNYEDAKEKELSVLNELNEDIDAAMDFQKLKEFDATNGVNKPNVKNTGLIPVTINSDGSLNTVLKNTNWYNYDGTINQWANAKTEDGSMWVWIPRYAYKITYIDTNDKSKGGAINVVFLKGITNLDANGNDVTSEAYVDENGNMGAYIVHPAFKNGAINGFANGEWDNEITGFWVAKFEAGYAGTAGDTSTAQDSKVNLTATYQWNGTTNEDLLTNYYGVRKIGDAIKYPIFQANRPSMNNLSVSDANELCKSLTAEENPYKLKNVDSHMTKNSEWGAITYLAYSKYGRNGQEVTINNVSVNNENTIYAVTGYGATTPDATEDITRNLETLMSANNAGNWTTTQGQTASTTGNIYGIYDLSGGNGEFSSGYVNVGTNYETYGKSFEGKSNKYESQYVGTIDATVEENYMETLNIIRIGEAIWETSTNGRNFTSWNDDISLFIHRGQPFTSRGGNWSEGLNAGIFSFTWGGGHCGYNTSFRAILINK